MIRTRGVGIILENNQGEVLLLLRDDKWTIPYPGHWTLVGGKIEEGENAETAAHREMSEEIGMNTELVFWKEYENQHDYALVDQHIYTGKIDTPCELLKLGEGQEVRFFGPQEIDKIEIGFEFAALLKEYFLRQKTG